MKKPVLLWGFGVWAIKKVLRAGSSFGFYLLIVAGRNIFFQAPEENAEFHVGRNVTDPDMHASFQFIKMFVDLKPWTFHEIGREKSGDSLNNPGVVFDIPVAGSKFDSFVHW